MSRPKHSKARAAGASQRQLRAAELVRHALVEILAREELRDPALAGVRVTLGEVRASPDLQHMICFVAPLGGGDPKAVAEGLTRCAGFLRGRLGREVILRHVPSLKFVPDESYAAASHIEALLRRPDVARDLVRDDDGTEET